MELDRVLQEMKSCLTSASASIDVSLDARKIE